MALPKILVLVLVGGNHSRMHLLPETRATPAVPLAGVYRLQIFYLSYAQHSSIAADGFSLLFQPTPAN